MLEVGWQTGTNAEWAVDLALFPARDFAFREETQPKLWADLRVELRTLHGVGLERLLLATLSQELDLKRAADELRHGLEFFGRTFRLATSSPRTDSTRRCCGSTT